MILKGSQRAGARQLALHLMKTDDNEQIDVHEVRGFVSSDLKQALHEAYAVSRGTRCEQFLFSLSLNPPESEFVPVEVFESTLSGIEAKLGLTGQPRVVVFHEKEGRRHAHCVWSRIDPDTMKAINLPHYKLKLRYISRQLYIEHGWTMPKGLMDSQECDPLNFSREEWQQAKRTGQDVRALKTVFQDCWAISDSKKAFAHALAAHGLYLAKGDRRGVVAVDFRGEVYAIARWVGLRTRQVKDRLGDIDDLPTVAETKAKIANNMLSLFEGHRTEIDQIFSKAETTLDAKRAAMAERHRTRKLALIAMQEKRWRLESIARSERFRKGVLGLWDRITGRHRRMREHNEREVEDCRQRDRAEQYALTKRRFHERLPLQREIRQARKIRVTEERKISEDMAFYIKMGRTAEAEQPPQTPTRRRRRRRTAPRL